MTHFTYRMGLLAGAAALALMACNNAAPTTSEPSDMTSTADSAADADPYLWLEEVEGEEALGWVREQNDRSLAELEADAAYQPLHDAAMEILTSDERIPGVALRGGYAYNFWQDDTHVRGIWRRMAQADYIAGASDWEVVLDLDAVAEAEGENWVYKGVTCLAPDYDRCILTLSRGGSDAAVRREYIISEQRFVADGFNLEEAKSSVAWIDADTLLVGMDTGDGSMTESGYPRTTRRWSRGQDIADAPVVFEAEFADMGVWPFSTWSNGAYVSGLVRAQTFYESDVYLAGSDGSFGRLELPKKHDFSGYLKGQVVLTLNEAWAHGGTTYPTGAVVGYDPAEDKVSLLYEAADRVAVSSVLTTENLVYLQLLDNINGRVLRLEPSAEGWTENEVALPANGVVSLGSADDTTGDLLVYYENPTTPDTLYFVKVGEAPAEINSLPAFYAADDVVTQQLEAVSADGTRIPYFVMARKDVLDAGPAPTIQYGYGGFQIPILPNYSATTGKMWLERGGVYVIANIRGGGEFGPEWHQAGLKQNRQRIYDDFYAVSEDLIANGITTADQLGILGGSNGGLLMGVSMTQRPDLYKAVGIGVPLLDMLRYDKLLAGASWVGEYGDPDNPDERAFLESISPYHNLDPDTTYPRPYFFTSTKDDRVHPAHARKMAKKMADYGMPFLYFENIEGGHGAAANQKQQAKRLALQYVYFGNELGLK